jgi:hypothetical protein
VQAAGDRRDRLAVGARVLDLGVALPGPGDDLVLRWRRQRGRGGRWVGVGSSGRGSRRQPRWPGTVSFRCARRGVVPQVPAVGDLDGPGAPVRAPSASAPARSRQITRGRDARQARQQTSAPPGLGAGRSADGCSCRPGRWRRCGHAGTRNRPRRARRPGRSWVGRRAQQPQQGVAACRQPKPTGQACTGASCQRQADGLQHPLKQRGAPGGAGGQPWDLLGERAGLAVGWSQNNRRTPSRSTTRRPPTAASPSRRW